MDFMPPMSSIAAFRRGIERRWSIEELAELARRSESHQWIAEA
jgi:hypothetical protein